MALMEQILRGRKDISVSAKRILADERCKQIMLRIQRQPILFPKEEYFIERCFVEEKMQVLVDLNRERADFSMHYGNCRPERRMSFAFGDQKLERTDYVKHYKDFNGDASRGGSSVGRGLKSVVYYGVRERTNAFNEGVDLRDAIRLKRRLSTVQPGSCIKGDRGNNVGS